MKTIRILCAALLVLAMLLPLAGCAADPAALTYGESSITTNMYRYWLSSYKGTFMYTYTDMEDTDTFWDSVQQNGMTAEEYLNGIVLDNAKRNLVCADLFREYGLTLSDTALADIDTYIADLVEQYADGSRRSFNQTLARFGVNADILRDIYVIEDQVTYLYDHLYGENGPRALTDEDYTAYLQDNYVRVRHIYVNNTYAYQMTEEGYYAYDTEGKLITRELTAEELAEKTEKIAAIDKALADGEDFETVYETYSEDLYYENGYYLTRTTDFIDEVVTAAFALELGDTVRLESDFGVHYLMRLELDPSAYGDEKNADFFDGFKDKAAQHDFLTMLDELIQNVEVNEEEISRYSIRDAEANYSI